MVWVAAVSAKLYAWTDLCKEALLTRATRARGDIYGS
jgi:hypothetical protein